MYIISLWVHGNHSSGIHFISAQGAFSQEALKLRNSIRRNPYYGSPLCWGFLIDKIRYSGSTILVVSCWDIWQRDKIKSKGNKIHTGSIEDILWAMILPVYKKSTSFTLLTTSNLLFALWPMMNSLSQLDFEFFHQRENPIREKKVEFRSASHFFRITGDLNQIHENNKCMLMYDGTAKRNSGELQQQWQLRKPGKNPQI